MEQAYERGCCSQVIGFLCLSNDGKVYLITSLAEAGTGKGYWSELIVQ